MSLSMQLDEAGAAAPAMAYHWDVATDMLTVRVAEAGASGSETAVELAGEDGSWLILDVRCGQLVGLEVAIWPEVVTRPGLVPPASAVDGRLTLRPPAPRVPGRIGDIEISVSVEADEAEEVIYFRVGTGRAVRTVRVGRELLVDLDRQSRIAGFWLLGVPPFPST